MYMYVQVAPLGHMSSLEKVAMFAQAFYSLIQYYWECSIPATKLNANVYGRSSAVRVLLTVVFCF